PDMQIDSRYIEVVIKFHVVGLRRAVVSLFAAYRQTIKLGIYMPGGTATGLVPEQGPGGLRRTDVGAPLLRLRAARRKRHGIEPQTLEQKLVGLQTQLADCRQQRPAAYLFHARQGI